MLLPSSIYNIQYVIIFTIIELGTRGSGCRVNMLRTAPAPPADKSYPRRQHTRRQSNGRRRLVHARRRV